MCKNKLYVLLVLFLMPYLGHAKITIYSKSCSSIGVNLNQVKEDFTYKEYCLEQQLIEGVWMKIAELSNRNEDCVFDNLKPGVYRVTFVSIEAMELSKQSNWTLSNNVSNVIKLSCDEQGPIKIDYPSDFWGNEISIYPNPTNEILHIRLKEFNVASMLIKIFNTSGKILNTFKMDQSVFDLNVSKYPSGLYFIEIESQGLRERRKFFIY